MLELTIDSESATPIRVQLRTILLESIKKGIYPIGRRIPSERDLAERYRVSRTSVRETIAELINEGVLVRTGPRGTFVSETGAPRKSPTGARQITFLISQDIFHFVQPGYNQILTGLTEVCRQSGYGLVFHPVAEEERTDELIAALKAQGEVEGLVVAGGLKKQLLDRLQELPGQSVVVDLLLANTKSPSVTIDYPTGVGAVVDHLHKLGHTEIGFIGFAGSLKYEAFWQSLEACGLSYHPGHVHFLEVSDLQPSILAGFHAMRKMIGRGRLPTALFVTNDLVAVGAVEALTIAHIPVPEGMSIVGCDDLGQSVQPPLTTIRVDLIEVGRLAGRTLLAKIRGGPVRDDLLLVPVELVVRGSTGPRLPQPETSEATAG